MIGHNYTRLVNTKQHIFQYCYDWALPVLPSHLDVITRLTTVFKGIMIIDVRNEQGITPLMKAALQGRTKCVRALLNAGRK
uniref:Uncharacterized protein n=1 Tax=Strigamia maritima TaxID=126957 RepID=T1JJ75_STRMM